MVQRYYSSNARETSLTGSISSSDTSIQVDNPVGYPSQLPFTVICELGTSSEEIMLVTGVAGNTWTVTRAYDSSTAIPHSVGAKIVHGVSAIDFDDFSQHANATTNVHGVTGALVGTTSVQTLTNKTLTSPTINSATFGGATSLSGATLTTPSITNPTITGGGSWADSPTLVKPTIADFSNAKHTHENDASGGVLPGGGPGSSLPRVIFSKQSSRTLDGLVSWSSPVVNEGGIWSSSDPASFTAPVDGIYLVGASVDINSTNSDTYYIRVDATISQPSYWALNTTKGGTYTSELAISTAIPMFTGESAQVYCSGRSTSPNGTAYNGYAICLMRL